MLMNTYKRPEGVFVSGEGINLFDSNGDKYLDLVSGIAVNTLGHCHPKVSKTLEDQGKKLIHLSNLYETKEQEKLAKKILSLSNHESLFFCNSGSEAVEGALKIARKYGVKKCLGKNKILYMKNSFHGRTMGALSVTGQKKYQEEYKPLIGGTEQCELNNIKSIYKKLAGACAIIVEPCQGEGGLVKAEIEFLKELREICDKWNCLLIFDEVQCGIGRSGSFFAYEEFGVVPDIVCIAKGLGGGVPIGAILVNKRANVLSYGDHGSTFGGNPLVCAVGNTIVEELIDNKLLDSVKDKANLLENYLEKLNKDFEVIEEVRGLGLLQGLKLKIDPKKVVDLAFNMKVLLVGAGDNVVRVIPPLNVTIEEIDDIYIKLKEIFLKFEGEGC